MAVIIALSGLSYANDECHHGTAHRRTHAHCCYKLLKDTHMPNNTRATRVEGLERLRFSLARQNANGLHYLLH